MLEAFFAYKTMDRAVPNSDFYNTICARECRNTHHKLVMNSLLHLRCSDAETWRELFVKHFELYLEGSKAPDTEFKDFKNHVLHVSDNFWGGPVKQAEKWYAATIRELQNEAWSAAAYSAGVLSHYYMDPLMPLHTGQTEEEGVIHRACEWSVNKSFESLIEELEQGPGYPSVELSSGSDWLKEAIHDGATRAHAHYQDFIDHYNFAVGSKKPTEGLNDHLRGITAGLLGHASVGFARILEKAFEESGATPVAKPSPLVRLFYQATAPVSWTYRAWQHLKSRSQVNNIASEFDSTGKVIKALPRDEKVIRSSHAAEVLKVDLAELDAKPLTTIGSKTTSPLEPKQRIRPASPPATQASTTKTETTNSSPSESDKGMPRKLTSPERQYLTRPVNLNANYTFRLNLEDPLEDAPSIGRKTAARFAELAILSVADFLMADPDAVAVALNTRHIQPKTIEQWQTQTKLACQIPQIYGHDAQILEACGFQSPEEVAQAEPELILSLVDDFKKTKESEFILRSSKAPDLEEVTNWIEWSKQSRELTAA